MLASKRAWSFHELDVDNLNSRNEEIKRRSWSSLPEDLLRIIKGKLYFADRTRLGAVCKNWHIPNDGIGPVERFPWIMTYNWHSPLTKCKLSDPICQKTYTHANGYTGQVMNFLDDAKVCVSKYGWLLLAKGGVHNTMFFLYTPFINEVLILPEFSSHYDVVNFSSSPTSGDCVFFVACRSGHDKLCISTCHFGDKKWETKLFEGAFEGPVRSVTYSEGTFYCVFGCGTMGGFSVANQSWSPFANTLLNWYILDRIYAVESEGQIYCVKSSYEFDKWWIFRFDRLQMTWITEESLGNRVLFVGCNSFLVPTVEDTTDLADKICYNAYSETKMYSLKDGKMSNETGFYDWMEQEWTYRVWIQTPCHRVS